MPRLRQGGIVGILQSMTQAAEGARKALSDVHSEVSGIGDEAERISRITPSTQPSTFGPPDPIRPRPGNPPPPTVLDSSGRPITRSNLGGGGSVSSGGSGGSGGGGGGGAGFKGGGLLQSLDGQRRISEEWIAAFCVRRTITVPARLGGLGSREIEVWDCTGVLSSPPSVIFPTSEGGVLASISGRRSGGAGTTRGTNISDRPGAFDAGGAFGGRSAGGSGISGPGFQPGESTGHQGSSSGLSTTAGIEQRLDRTNTLLEKAIRGDGGTGLRAGGLV